MAENEKNLHEHDCGCGHDHHHEHGDDCGCGHHHTIELTLENDETINCTVLGVFEVEGFDKEYIALLPENGEDVYFYVYNEHDDGVELTNIEDEDEFNKVGEEFMAMLEEDEETEEE